MSELIAIIVPDRYEAEYARIAVLEMRYLLDLSDIVVAEVDEAGTIKLHQSVQLVGLGAIERGFLGTLVGLIFHSPPFERAVGATVEVVGGWQADFGIDGQFMQELARQVAAGKAALFFLVDQPLSQYALKRLRGVGGTVMRSSLDAADERKLHAYLETLRRPVDSEYTVPGQRVGEEPMWCEADIETQRVARETDNMVG